MSKTKTDVVSQDSEMAQATFAAILAAQKGDDALAGEILRNMAAKMMGKYADIRGGKAVSER